MKRCNLSIFALAAVSILTTMTTAYAEDAARVPDTAAARLAADVIARAERAVAAFVAACEGRDAPGMDRVTTSDARIEFTLDDPGTFLSLDASALSAACAANRPGRPDVRPGNYWIFPTNDANTVFVQYDAPAHTGAADSHQHLALVEMRGDRILRMLNFASMPSGVVASTLRAAAAASSSPAICGARSIERDAR